MKRKVLFSRINGILKRTMVVSVSSGVAVIQSVMNRPDQSADIIARQSMSDPASQASATEDVSTSTPLIE